MTTENDSSKQEASSSALAGSGVLVLTDEHCLHFAMRYALGRMTAAPGIVVDKIQEVWPRIRPATQAQMQREIREAIRTNTAGELCDVETWRRVLHLPNAAGELQPPPNNQK